MGTGPMFTGTGWHRAWLDRDGSGTVACGNGREWDWRTSPVQYSMTVTDSPKMETSLRHSVCIIAFYSISVVSFFVPVCVYFTCQSSKSSSLLSSMTMSPVSCLG